jgi:hypothetical protein
VTTTTRPVSTTPPHLYLAAGGRRVEELAAKFGPDSPQVASCMARWARHIDEAQHPSPNPESLEAVLASIADDEHVEVIGLPQHPTPTPADQDPASARFAMVHHLPAHRPTYPGSTR